MLRTMVLVSHGNLPMAPVRLSVPVFVRESVPAPWIVLLSVRGVVSLNWSVPLTKGLPFPERTVAPLSSRSVAPAEIVPPPPDRGRLAGAVDRCAAGYILSECGLARKEKQSGQNRSGYQSAAVEPSSATDSPRKGLGLIGRGRNCLGDGQRIHHSLPIATLAQAAEPHFRSIRLRKLAFGQTVYFFARFFQGSRRKKMMNRH